MVDTLTPPYGSFDRTALQDLFLQFLKGCERALYAGSYGKLALESEKFFASHRKYSFYPELNPTSSILIFKPDDIGDAVYALPGLLELRRILPQAKLYLLCQAKTRAFYERTQIFDQVVDASPHTRFLRFQFLDLDSALDEFPTERFDLAVFLRTYPAYFNYFKKIKAAQCIVPKDPRLASGAEYLAYTERQAHQSLQMSQILSRVSPLFHFSEKYPSFHWTEEDKKAMTLVFGTSTPSPYVVLHPYARYETRRYPYDYWRFLIGELLKKTGLKMVIIGGKEDPSLEIEGSLETQGKLTLTQTGYLLANARAFIGNESGPGHWASALGIPTAMVMSGHSHLKEWGPVGNHLILKKEVSCQDCYLRACPFYKVKCLTEMKPFEVLHRILPFLERNGMQSC